MRIWKKNERVAKLLRELDIKTAEYIGSTTEGRLKRANTPFILYEFKKRDGVVIPVPLGKLDLAKKIMWTKEEAKELRIGWGSPAMSVPIEKILKKYKALKKAGFRVPRIVIPDYERRAIVTEYLPEGSFVDCSMLATLDKFLRENPKYISVLARELSRLHKSGWVHVEHKPLSAIYLIKEKGEYKPVVFDVNNLSRVRFLKKFFIKESLKYLVGGLLKRDMAASFIKEYAKHDPKMGNYMIRWLKKKWPEHIWKEYFS